MLSISKNSPRTVVTPTKPKVKQTTQPTVNISSSEEDQPVITTVIKRRARQVKQENSGGDEGFQPRATDYQQPRALDYQPQPRALDYQQPRAIDYQQQPPYGQQPRTSDYQPTQWAYPSTDQQPQPLLSGAQWSQ